MTTVTSRQRFPIGNLKTCITQQKPSRTMSRLDSQFCRGADAIAPESFECAWSRSPVGPRLNIMESEGIETVLPGDQTPSKLDRSLER